MSCSEKYKEHIEYMFNTFYKVLLRSAAIDAYHNLGRKQKRDVSLDDLMSETPFELSTTDRSV